MRNGVQSLIKPSVARRILLAYLCALFALSSCAGSQSQTSGTPTPTAGEELGVPGKIEGFFIASSLNKLYAIGLDGSVRELYDADADSRYPKDNPYGVVLGWYPGTVLGKRVLLSVGVANRASNSHKQTPAIFDATTNKLSLPAGFVSESIAADWIDDNTLILNSARGLIDVSTPNIGPGAIELDMTRKRAIDSTHFPLDFGDFRPDTISVSPKREYLYAWSNRQGFALYKSDGKRIPVQGSRSPIGWASDNQILAYDISSASAPIVLVAVDGSETATAITLDHPGVTTVVPGRFLAMIEERPADQSTGQAPPNVLRLYSFSGMVIKEVSLKRHLQFDADVLAFVPR